jgi:lipopolysaccharide/colanic/teichoic acid biosynthesis glycosyltransferase
MSLSWNNELVAEYSAATEWRKLFRMRPTQTQEVIFGFLLRLLVSIVAVITASIPTILVGWLNNWHFTNTLLFLFGFIICAMVLFGEHLRSRIYERIIAESHPQLIGNDEIAQIDNQEGDAPNLIAEHRFKKRIFDIVAATMVLFVLAPLLIVVTVAVLFDGPGPILFRQRRRGYNRKELTIYKFRALRISDDDALIPEVTRVGRFLLRTNLDEAPQLFNVLFGSMSFVGPRPLASKGGEQCNPQDILPLLFVKPGITGWAQIHGLRGASDEPRMLDLRLRYDLWYATHWSVILDLRILLRTLFLTKRPA